VLGYRVLSLVENATVNRRLSTAILVSAKGFARLYQSWTLKLQCQPRDNLNYLNDINGFKSIIVFGESLALSLLSKSESSA